MATKLKGWAKRHAKRAGHEGMQAVQVVVKGKTGTHMATRWKKVAEEAQPEMEKIVERAKALRAKEGSIADLPTGGGKTELHAKINAIAKRFASEIGKGSNVAQHMKDLLEASVHHAVQARKIATDARNRRIPKNDGLALAHVHDRLSRAFSAIRKGREPETED